ncbi:MAG: sensor histidine kinase [Sphingomonas sp.]|uniref:histidine kinase dimerization/phospho-acceptor domain-containing protein n=1 Tax=Sphingomonas sp. TaxID=28214 RepID=UPI000DB3D2BA|nr:sensor histidine kinase [Sphingomonas sp.]PZP20186.1 MAG: histidine kinase [Sphingomonas hengshuiensis]
MRFNDSLATVLAIDASTPSGAQAAWRQLVDLAGRGRIDPTTAVIEKLDALRAHVPETVRAASARALALTRPPAALVRLFADDNPAVAAPLLRAAQLDDPEWIEMLTGIGTQGRALLRHRRDLSPGVIRALADFGAIDFRLADPHRSDTAATDAAPPMAERAIPRSPPLPIVVAAEDEAWHAEPPPESDFTAFAAVAQALPAVVEAMRRADPGDGTTTAAPPDAEPDAAGPFEIADLVQRIDAFRRQRDAGIASEAEPGAARPRAGPTLQAARFQFETDAMGIIQWVSGVERAPIIGVSLGLGGSGRALVDQVASGAFHRRAAFTDARLDISGTSGAAGAWRLSAQPVFDRERGSFAGYRGTARRPRLEEQPHVSPAAAESLRQLVHELRTPTTAIAGFAEMIDGAILGPVDDVYRRYAAAIVAQARALLGAIDDLDLAARIEMRALDLLPHEVALAPLLVRIVRELEPLASLREAEATLDIGVDVVARGDDRTIERLLVRLIAALLSAAQPGEAIAILATREDDDAVVRLTRPALLARLPATAALQADSADDEIAAGASLLGSDFALRLAMNLARELGGSLVLGDARLTLRLPAAFAGDMGQALNS